MKRSKVKKVDIDNKNKPVIISNSDNEVKEYVCDSCNFIIRTRLTDGEITCYHCGNVIEIQETRKRSKLETPHKNTETLVSTTPMPGDVAIKKLPNYKGSFAELHKKGIKIKDYKVTDGAERPIYEE